MTPPTVAAAGSGAVHGMAATVVGLHLLGVGALLLWLLPAQAAAGADPGVLLGLALSAWALGVRHAFDADHIAAIDNATRRLLARGRPAATTGFWFALGHSSVVLLAVVGLSLGVASLTGGLADEHSSLREGAGVWGASVSGLFLLTAGLLNVPTLRGLLRLRRSAGTRSATEGSGDTAIDRASLAAQLDRRGVLHRVLRPVGRWVGRPAAMYPVGFLFGLGLDTAATIGLFVLAGALAPGLPWYAALVLPVLFTAGMSAFDSADGLLMSRVYRHAADDARRTLDLNLVITAVSVGVAFLVGGANLLGVLGDVVVPLAGLPALSAVADVDLNLLGVALAAFSALVWAALASRRRRPDVVGG
ncbi:nickel/cobalt efflux system [Tersicoccus solisilvae]|uniref:Nickel/cobalt efflux system n=1 Tax=Tersicoccus solisilvae TaxID=1882339 RepID=A0ABQ1NL75_9MICC|nr:HoxN/HupN/NixA family nickel/cobalt transporter [Tersicoccus solisilvae]GGC79954.1 nickel/cobalt efflux system [Tersicoccus solisilvae]